MPPRPPTPPSASGLGIGRPSTPVRRPNASTPFHPPSDTSTYRDLLLFEERLKMNAEMLRRRRRRYRIFLWSFVIAFAVGAYRLLTRPPDNIVLLRGLQALVAVVFITLFLFFASGMHEEKIRYAYSYINHSNKALRPLNMYLNVRRPPTTWRTLLSYLPLPGPLAPSLSQPQVFKSTAGPKSRIPSVRRVSHSSGQSHTVMAQIPPSTNPRGELIFSSRVDPHFEEGYKRYRAAFERRREERQREEARLSRPWWRGGGRRASGAPSPRASSPVPRGLGVSPRPTPGPSPPASPRKPRASPSPNRARRREEQEEREGDAPQERREKDGRERADTFSFAYNVPGEAVSAAARAR